MRRTVILGGTLSLVLVGLGAIPASGEDDAAILSEVGVPTVERVLLEARGSSGNGWAMYDCDTGQRADTFTRDTTCLRIRKDAVGVGSTMYSGLDVYSPGGAVTKVCPNMGSCNKVRWNYSPVTGWLTSVDLYWYIDGQGRGLGTHKAWFCAGTSLSMCNLGIVKTTFTIVDAVAGPPKCMGEPATIVGTAGDDQLSGTAGDDVIVGRGGNDTIYGRGGDDIICAGPGDDTVYGGTGNDILLGASGNDTLEGNAGDDILKGKKGEDRLLGGAGWDRLNGGVGLDVCEGSEVVAACP